MASFRKTAWSERLKPIALELDMVAARWAQSKSDEELVQLLKDTSKPTSENCSFFIYHHKDALQEAIRNERARRSNIAQRRRSEKV